MSILEKIIEVKKQEVKALYADYSLKSFSDSEFFSVEPLSLLNEITKTKDISIIAEVKKASPSKGILVEDFHPLKIARSYFENGASAVSVLTDKQFFMGDIKYLNRIASVKTGPVLMKDFMIDPIQIYEAKANGADAVLLISEALSKDQIAELSRAALEIGLEVLLELHSEDQLDKIDFKLNRLIGINNRNLKDFVTNVQTTIDIAALLPEEVTVVSESGILGKDTLSMLKRTRTNAVLAGEYFMRSGNIAESLKEFKLWCSYES